MRRVAQFGDGVDEGTAAKGVGRKPTFEPVEITQNLLEQRPIGRLGLDEVTREIRDDQLVLRRKIVIERALADADFRRDGIDTDGPDALPIEQPACGIENPLLHGLLGGPAAHDCTGLCNFCLTVGMDDVLLTQVGVVKVPPSRGVTGMNLISRAMLIALCLGAGGIGTSAVASAGAGADVDVAPPAARKERAPA